MLLKIANTGIIHEANVALNGLTIIAGENDTGKSTVGKLMFSIVKAVSRYEQDLQESKEYQIQKLLEDIYLDVRRYSDRRNEASEWRESFIPRNFLNVLRPFFDEKVKGLFDIDNTELELIFKERKKQTLNNPDISPQLVKRIIEKLEKLEETLVKEDDKNILIKRALNRALISEFYSELSPKNSKQISTLEIVEGNIKILNLEINENEVTKFNVNDILQFDDVTFIETPIILQMYNVLNAADTLFELSNETKSYVLGNLNKPKIPLHLKDLIAKLENARYYSNNLYKNNFEHIEILKEIAKTINGDFTFEKNQKDFVFSKKINDSKNVEIKSVNTASGIKSFGIIQLLIQAGFIDNRSLIIIDEPETHLHPKWQIEYAKLLIELVKNEISILVTSHSPYFIQALKVLSDQAELQSQTNFYIAEKKQGTTFSNIKDVTNDLNRIFQKLAEPLQELVWQ